MLNGRLLKLKLVGGYTYFVSIVFFFVFLYYETIKYFSIIQSYNSIRTILKI